jgi:hypothetical protein
LVRAADFFVLGTGLVFGLGIRIASVQVYQRGRAA